MEGVVPNVPECSCPPISTLRAVAIPGKASFTIG